MRDFARTLFQVEKISDPTARDLALTQLVESWAEHTPRDAAEFARNQTAGARRENLIRRLVLVWVIADPTSALTWVRQLSDPMEQQRTLAEICLGLSEHNPREVLRAALDLHLDKNGDGLIENLTAQWAAQDLAAAHEWVKQQPVGGWRDGMLARVAFVSSQSNPSQAARWVSTEMQPGRARDEAVISVLHQWTLRDLDAALAWADSFPIGPLRERALSELLSLQPNSPPASATAK